MRILSRLIGYLFWIGILAALLFYLVPQVQRDMPPGVFYKEEDTVPTDLHPVVEQKKEELMDAVHAKGIDVVITEGHRTMERQDALYAQGRSEGGSIVTSAKGGESYHNYGLAIDFALRTAEGDVVWDRVRDDNGNGEPDWMEVVEEAKSLGFEWGGDWSNFKDYPHLQMDFGLTIRDLKNGKRPVVDDFADD
ncbi:M15 family metallopeptidase [Halobacillus sp. ACCC02827]|uniref:M15 family metallopeptidase n=1 Tax=Halobacillus sp. ACCC02827 TaxID=3052090 RepID=UPI00257001B4|nr:M15 family metallopeptidase [Halobacillus sp. ACCC02827]WJE16550.1 M15 family metallopeptidase [Halobacillus sp. ACCC02827]